MWRLLAILFAALPLLGQPADWQAGVVQVSAKDRSPGSGFVVAVRSGRAYIVTCSHVVEGDPKPVVTFRAAPEEPYPAAVRDQQAGRMEGLALLVVDRPPAGVRALPPVTESPEPGASVVVAGYLVSTGTFSVLPATVVTTKGTELYLSPATREGFSGGPVMAGGRVIAIVFAHGRDEFGHAVPAGIADIYLRGLGLDLRWGTEIAQSAGPTATVIPAAGTVRSNPKDGLKYVWIPPGTFGWGCSPGDNECQDDEKPQEEVTIPQGYWMGQTEVTQAAYQRVVGSNPSSFKGSQRPVEGVTWDEAGAYCEKVGLRLPTAAEWEYAGRAGSRNSRYAEIGNIAWYSGNSGDTTHDAGQKQANSWGLYDMLGNVWEWTSDLNPGATSRILHGGSWNNPPRSVRVSVRGGDEPSYRNDNIGFRCAGELR